MPQPRLVPLILLLTALSALTGCHNPKATRSGFLTDYDQLQPHPKIKKAWLYTAPGFSLAHYDRFLVDPVQLRLDPTSKGPGVNPKRARAVTDFLETRLKDGLAQRDALADAPGPRVMRLRIALTQIDKTEPLLNIHPLTKLSGIGLGGATFEAEGLDSLTDQRVIALIDPILGTRIPLFEGWSPTGHAKQAALFWIDRFFDRLDQAEKPPDS